MLRVIENVRCLACGSLYSKPSDGGTAETNPGCPDCGYLGWRSLIGEVAPLQHHFAGGPRRTRSA